MSRELQCQAEPGNDLFAIVHTRDWSAAWSEEIEQLAVVNQDFVTNIEHFRIGTDDVTGLGDYAGDMPPLPAGTYGFIFIDGDNNRFGEGVIVWDGEREVDLPAHVRDLLEADRNISKANPSHWTLRLTRKGTGVDGDVLLEQPLYDVDGNPLANINTKPARALTLTE